MKAIFAIGVLLGSLAVGCGATCPTLPHTDPEAALLSHRSIRQRAHSIRAEARVEQWGAEGRIRGTVLMFVERPNRVRFDAMTQFGPAAILTSDGESFALTDLRENRYLVGPTCPENIARLLGIPMSSADVSLFLLGDTPRIEAEQQSIQCTRRGNYLTTLVSADGRRQEIEFAVREADRGAPPEQQQLRLARSEVWGPDGDREWRATFENHRVTEDPRSEQESQLGVAMPFEIHFEDTRHDADTYVRFRSIDLNVDVPEEAFRQDPRSGIETELVECTGESISQ